MRRRSGLPAVVAVVVAIAVPAPALGASTGFESSVHPLSAKVRAQLRHQHFWRSACPVPLSGLRVVRVAHWNFGGHRQIGRVIVNAGATGPVRRVMHKLYKLHFPIHHLSIGTTYVPARDLPSDQDVSGSFSCRQAVPSPCVGGTGTGTWSMHAYGLALDLNPVENPYVGCGMSRDPRARKYRDRSVHRKGMITPKVIAAFRSVGWGWGGAWAGDTKDYMHFSSNGH